MGSLDSLYQAGLGGDRAEEATGPTPIHAMAALRTTDKLGTMIHRDISRYARTDFQRFWARFYNDWLTYRTLQAEQRARTDPARVVDIDLPRYVKRFYEWRDALAKERGADPATGARLASGAAQPQSGSPWKTVAIIGGVAIGGWIVKSWWDARRQQQAEEAVARAEAERATVAATLQRAMQPQVAPPPTPFGWYSPVPPGYAPAPVAAPDAETTDG